MPFFVCSVIKIASSKLSDGTLVWGRNSLFWHFRFPNQQHSYYIVRLEENASSLWGIHIFYILIHKKMVFEKTTHFKLKLDFIAFSLYIFRTLLRIFSLLRCSLSSLNLIAWEKNAFSIEEHTFTYFMVKMNLKAFRTHLKLPSKWRKEGVSQDCF